MASVERAERLHITADMSLYQLHSYSVLLLSNNVLLIGHQSVHHQRSNVTGLKFWSAIDTRIQLPTNILSRIHLFEEKTSH